MGCNAICGVMHNVADISGAISNILQSGIVCCETCWCDMVRNDGLTCNVVWFGIMSEMVFDVERCNVKCGNDVARCNGNVIHSTSNHISGTAHHITSHI